MPYKDAEARKAYMKSYAEKHRDKVKAKQKEWREANAEHHQMKSRAWYYANKQLMIDRAAEWARNNREKVRVAQSKYGRENKEKGRATAMAYYANKTNSTPSWGRKRYIELFYKMAKIEQDRIDGPVHVDHIVPLRSGIVCGLHVEHNLQLLTAKHNQSKGNRQWPDMW